MPVSKSNAGHCQHCNGPMSGPARQKFCSDSCRAKAHREANKPTAPVSFLPAQREDFTPPSPPEALGATGLIVWDLLWAHAKALRPVDAFVVARYCALHDRAIEIRRAIDGEGWSFDNVQGNTVMHPLARFLLDIEKELSRLEDRLGLNPASGALVVEAEALSALEMFLQEGAA